MKTKQNELEFSYNKPIIIDFFKKAVDLGINKIRVVNYKPNLINVYSYDLHLQLSVLQEINFDLKNASKHSEYVNVILNTTLLELSNPNKYINIFDKYLYYDCAQEQIILWLKSSKFSDGSSDFIDTKNLYKNRHKLVPNYFLCRKIILKPNMFDEIHYMYNNKKYNLILK